MKVVPEDVSTAPLEGAVQGTTVNSCGRHEIDDMDNCMTYVNNLVQSPTSY